jgi:preprotein translocase subunit SecE
MDAILTYFRGSLEELRHVRWPTRQQAVRLTIIVLIFIVVNAFALAVIDSALTAIIDFIVL